MLLTEGPRVGQLIARPSALDGHTWTHLNVRRVFPSRENARSDRSNRPTPGVEP